MPKEIKQGKDNWSHLSLPAIVQTDCNNKIKQKNIHTFGYSYIKHDLWELIVNQFYSVVHTRCAIFLERKFLL